MQRIALRLVIRGRVQGVGYRWWASNLARRLGVDGWVRNLADGSVELHAEGPPQAVERLAEACARGPEAAEVADVERAPTAPEGLQGFQTRASA